MEIKRTKKKFKTTIIQNWKLEQFFLKLKIEN